jgi:hypothetical protein
MSALALSSLVIASLTAVSGGDAEDCNASPRLLQFVRIVGPGKLGHYRRFLPFAIEEVWIALQEHPEPVRYRLQTSWAFPIDWRRFGDVRCALRLCLYVGRLRFRRIMGYLPKCEQDAKT